MFLPTRYYQPTAALGGVVARSEAYQAIADETNGLALSFTDDFFLSSTSHYGSARVKDTSTPANNYNSHPFGLLTYAGASKKWVRGPNGLLIESDLALTLPYEWDENGDPLGILIEEQRTNLFLNNRAPVTQDITVTAQDYTLSFYGTGSITLSGAHSDTLNGTGEDDRVELTFEPSAGTLTCTVDGDIDFVQLEAGSFVTSPIQTAGSTVTRAVDNISLATSAFPYSDAAGTIVCKLFAVDHDSGTGAVSSNNASVYLGGSPTNSSGFHYLRLSKSDSTIRNSRFGVNIRNEVGSIQYIEISTDGSFPVSTPGKIGCTWGDANIMIASGVAGTTASNTFSDRPDEFQSFFLAPVNGLAHYQEVIYLPRDLTQQELESMVGA